MRRFISAIAIAGLCSLGSAAFAQDTGAKTEAKKAGQATKEAGKDTADAAKHAGKATAKGTKKAARATKNAGQRNHRRSIRLAAARARSPRARPRVARRSDRRAG